MAETSQPPPTGDTDGAPQPFAHVHADKQAVYRAILQVFSEAKQRFVVHLRPEDVAARLPSRETDVEAVTAALDQLVHWGNLRPYPDTSRVTTVEDFNRRRHVYALTPHGEAAEIALAAYADALGRRGELQAVALSDIRIGLRTLERLAQSPEPDVATVAASLRDLHTVFHNLAENATAFMATVQRSIDRSHLDVEEFLGYKERLIGYLQRFIGDLVVVSPEIATLLVRLDEADVDRLLHAVAQREAADAAPDGTAEGTTHAAGERVTTLRARWSGLRQWFVGGRDAPSQAALLRGRARAAIPALLDTVRALNERYAGRSDRAADFRALARWFAECEDDADAHRLWRGAPRPRRGGGDPRPRGDDQLAPPVLVLGPGAVDLHAPHARPGVVEVETREVLRGDGDDSRVAVQLSRGGAVAQAKLLPDLARIALDLERRRLGVGEQLGRPRADLELPGRKLWIDRLLGAADDRPGDGEDVLGAQPLFFAGTAPVADGHVNVSPKGLAGTFAVLGNHDVASTRDPFSRPADLSAVDEAVLQAGLCRALVRTCRERVRAGRPPPAVRTELLQAAKWRAARFGLEGRLFDPVSRSLLAPAKLFGQLLDELRDALDAEGDTEQVLELVGKGLCDGTAARGQRAAFAASGRLQDTVDLIARATCA